MSDVISIDDTSSARDFSLVAALNGEPLKSVSIEGHPKPLSKGLRWVKALELRRSYGSDAGGDDCHGGEVRREFLWYIFLEVLRRKSAMDIVCDNI